jgi:hypothetical protein
VKFKFDKLTFLVTEWLAPGLLRLYPFWARGGFAPLGYLPVIKTLFAQASAFLAEAKLFVF